ncbi:MAG: glycosyl hydrolase [Dehalococcoidia bacterium]|nr:glycosyl hydrolase [Dehalococcoidia bacterium]
MSGATFQNERPLDGKPGLILKPGEPGWWDSERVSGPRVIKLPDGRWRMYYYGRDATFDREINMQSGRIGLAESTDGINWVRVRGDGVMGAIMDPSTGDRFDSGHIGVSDIWYENGTYTMWYFGGDQKVLQLPGPQGMGKLKGAELRPGKAVSKDGIHWQRVDGPVRGALLDHGSMTDFDPLMVGWPQVVKEPDGSLKMYYHTYNPMRGGFLVGLAVSSDGTTWRKVGQVLGPGAPGSFDDMGISTRHVIKIQGRYYMFFEALNKQLEYNIGLAVSDDGINWTKDPKPVFYHAPKGSGAWDARAVGTPWVVPMADGSYRLYYVGMSETDNIAGGELAVKAMIGLAISDGPNFRRWRRYGADF